jgi:hypothetical protein
VVLIEPCDTWLGRVLDLLGLSTLYESPPQGSAGARRNYVYRWTVRQLACLLNSYYLDSGYVLDVKLGWMRSRCTAHPNPTVRTAASLLGWTIGFLPGCAGNMMSAVMLPGADAPPEPAAG